MTHALLTLTEELVDPRLRALPPDAIVAVAMSGGVDSSVAAACVAASGRTTIGITLALWPRNREVVRDRGCCSLDAVEDARRVASNLGIPHYVWDMEEEFGAEVITQFEEEYAAGRTPNPCVRCNQQIKFGVLAERAKDMGATHIATGHYARVRSGEAGWELLRSMDPQKDQSYTLHRLSQEQLATAVFPLGGMTSKELVREQAEALGFITARKADSQELCFVDTTLREELGKRLQGRFTTGKIRAEDGTVIGTHRGIPFYTVGQRSGVANPDRTDDAQPLFVLSINAANNVIVVGPRHRLERTGLRLHECIWTQGPEPQQGTSCELQLRAHGTPVPVTIEEATSSSAVIHALQPVIQVSPGQSGVLYDGDRVIGGGIIQDSW